MTLTFVGVIQLLVGSLLLLLGSVPSMFMFLIMSALFGGSAAAQLPALGGSSLPPMPFALVFVYARLLLPGSRQLGLVSEAFRANSVLALFAFYGIAAAYAAPRMFAGAISVTPLKLVNALSTFYVVPLKPTSQNITTSVDLVMTLLCAVAAYVVCRNQAGAVSLVRGAVVFAWIHSVSGVVSAVSKGTPIDDFLNLFRNGSYEQLDQTIKGFVRINGVFPEPSAYASVGFMWFVLNCELWYRSILPRSTGTAALLLGLVLFFSTSSTAYVGLACYVLFFLLRLIAFPQEMNFVRLRQVGFVLMGVLFAAALAMILLPQLSAAMGEIVREMTVEKHDSQSGDQRLFWAMQGWDAFVVSGGLGIGPGSFRSSSLFMAILGSMGVVGIVSFIYYLGQVVQPLRASTWGRVDDPSTAISAAAACSALLILIPQAILSASAVPSMTFALFCGAALALRPSFAARQNAGLVHAAIGDRDPRANAARLPSVW